MSSVGYRYDNKIARLSRRMDKFKIVHYEMFQGRVNV